MENKKNHIYGIVNNIIVMLSPIIIIPFAIKNVGIDEYGYFVQVNIIYSCLISIFTASLSGYFIKSYLEKKLSFHDIFIIQLFINLFSTAIIGIYILLRFDVVAPYIFVVAMLTNTLNFEWFFHAIGAQKQLLIRNLIIKTMFVIIAIFILEVYKNIAVYFVIFGLNIIIANFLLGIYSFTKIKNKEYILFSNGGGGNRLFCFIKDAKFFFLSPTIGAVYQYGDQILVSLLFPKTALVFINLAKQIIGASVMVSGTLCRVEQKNIFSSEKIERLTKIKKTLMAYVFYLMTTSILIILIGPLILGMLIKETVSLGLNYYILIAGIYVFTSLSIFIDYIIGLTFRTEHYTSISNICCATIVTLLNAMFLEKYGATFSLFSLFIGELLVFILLSIMHYINIKRRTYYNG